MAQNAIHIIRLDNPPVNALSQGLRQQIWQELDHANADPSVQGIVIIGTARSFSGGADIAEFGTAMATAHPSLNAVLARIEANPKPVVAALSGLALGGGLELALAAHGRVAHPDVLIGLPEVKLGIIPGAGGTQRLPRAIAVARAIDMMTQGAPRRASSFAQEILFDKITPDVEQEAVALAATLAGKAAPYPQLRDRPLTEGDLQQALKGRDLSKLRPAELGVIEALRAGTQLPFDTALEQEFRIFERLHDSAESIALRHAFFAERKAGRLEHGTKQLPAITDIGIVGSGTMGRGIAISALKAGLGVTIIDRNPQALDAATAAIQSVIARDVEKGRLSPAAADAALAHLHTGLDLAALRDAGLVIEAIYEDMAAKQALFAELDRICRADTLLASNTSMLDVNQIATAVRDPSRVIGLHFFSPAHLMKLVEVVETAHSSPDAIARGLAFCKKIGKIAVIAGVTHGFIGNRMLEAYLDRAFIMVEEGVSPYRIDAALEAWGMAMGPFRMLDLAGNDVSYMIRQTRRAMDPDRDIAALEGLVHHAGRLGQKTKAGWYDYGPDAPKGRLSDVVTGLVAQHVQAAKRAPRSYTATAIVEDLIATLAHEGQAILDQGFAKSASDIDVVYLHGYGFPRHRGGPMHYVQTQSSERLAS